MNNELSQREIKKAIPFKVTSKTTQQLGVNSTKDVKYLYTENYKTLMKEIEEDINKRKDSLCSWIGSIYIVKMSVLLKAIYRFNRILIKIPMARLSWWCSG